MKGQVKGFQDPISGKVVYPITTSDGVMVGGSKTLKDYISEKQIATGGQSRYVIDLVRWGINNAATDFTDKALSTVTSNQLNKAIKWAADNNYVEVIFPAGTYLIDETIPIDAQSYLTINFNRAKLRVRDNGLIAYKTVRFPVGTKFARMTNGIIVGDRWTHDYTQAGVHEGGHGIYIEAFCKFITVDNMDSYDFIGDAITLFNAQSYGFIPLDGHWETGGINLTTGASVVDATRIRRDAYIDLSLYYEVVKYGYIGINGSGFGSVGFTGDYFDMVFYDANNAFISTAKDCQMFDDITVPRGAKYIQLVIHQSAVPATGSIQALLSVFPYCSHVLLEMNHFHHCRRQGITVAGRYIWIEKNEIDNIKPSGNPGIGPYGGIDIEDGYQSNQYIWINQNNFHECNIGLTYTGCRNIYVTNNRFSSCPSNTCWDGVDQSTFIGNICIGTSWNFLGQVNISGCEFVRSSVSFNGNSNGWKKTMNDVKFNGSTFSINETASYAADISNIQMFGDANYPSTLNLFGAPQTISNVTLTGNVISTNTTGRSDWTISNFTYVRTMSESAIKIPAGLIRNCNFIETGLLQILSGTTQFFFLQGCQFESTNKNLFQGSGNVSGNYAMRITFKDCIFKLNGTTNSFSLSNEFARRIEFINCIFIFTGANTSTVFFNFFNAAIDICIFKSCHFIADARMKLVGGGTAVQKLMLVDCVMDGMDSGTISSGTFEKRNNWFDGVFTP